MAGESEERIGIAGAGRVARALGRLLSEAGESVVLLRRGDLEQAIPSAVRRVLIAVPDRALSEVAAKLAEHSAVNVALHTCGVHGPEVLAPLAAHGVECGTLHPLQTITHGTSLEGIAFAVWGDAAALAWAEEIAALAHGEVLRIRPECRALYHAAAVMASNYLITLLDASQTLLAQCGVAPDAALRALGPLARTSIENALQYGPANALTGPIERGDRETVAAHLEALKAAPARIRHLYAAAGLETLELKWKRLSASPIC